MEKPSSVKKQKINRDGVFSLDEVLPFVAMEPIVHRNKHTEPTDRFERIFNDKSVKLDSLRYQTFVSSGTTCVSCGLQGTFFALEQHPTSSRRQRKGLPNPHRWHLNLYGIDAEGDEVLFTKDHIVPKSRGGPNTLDNLQTMCYPCNHNKGNGITLTPEVDLLFRTLHRLTSKINNRIKNANAALRKKKNKELSDQVAKDQQTYFFLKEVNKEAWKALKEDDVAATLATLKQSGVEELIKDEGIKPSTPSPPKKSKARKRISWREKVILDALQGKKYKRPEWLLSVRISNREEDANGVDLIVDTDTGNIPIQVLSNHGVSAIRWLDTHQLPENLVLIRFNRQFLSKPGAILPLVLALLAQKKAQAHAEGEVLYATPYLGHSGHSGKNVPIIRILAQDPTGKWIETEESIQRANSIQSKFDRRQHKKRNSNDSNKPSQAPTDAGPSQ